MDVLCISDFNYRCGYDCDVEGRGLAGAEYVRLTEKRMIECDVQCRVAVQT